MKKKQPYQYGKSPNPRNWHEASEVLKGLQKKKPNPFMEKLTSVEQLLKERK